MSLSLKKAFWIIKNFADEVGYTIEEIGDYSIQLHLEKFHGVDFEVVGNASGYIQCSQWDEHREEYNRAVYSIRNVTDVIRFCSILENSEKLRAKRIEE
ncbi:hypothetical protein [Marinomonas flavescens]|uniref:hypothetical protein n=1 Tax=Marinomonas flavescens TaxID=2529379 RepID=UPI0010568CBB|nr:hypothetical protein [Marinomonas flavescens]